MEIGHSRLLKFILRNEPKMAAPETRILFDYREPENVQSKVPSEQNLRESVETSELAIAKRTLHDGDKTDNPGDYTLTPVVTVTKNEEIKNGVYVTLKPPAYPEIQSEVLHSKEAIRTMDDHTDNDAKKTRIPKLRFRQAAYRVKQERRSSEGEKVSYQRRSSIPKLKKSTSIERENSEEKIQPKEIASAPIEDEFDKIYDETVTSPVSIDDNILNTVIDDPVKIENSFEEIIHAYDENEQPVNVEKPKHSKIPMLKRKSEPQVEVPTNIEKTSVNNNSVGRLKVQDAINKYSKIDNEEPKPKYRIPTRTGIPKISTEKHAFDDNKNEKKVEVANVTNLPLQQNEVDTRNIDNIYNISYKNVDIIEEKAPIYNETIELLPASEITQIEIKSTQQNSPNDLVKIVPTENFESTTQNLLSNSEYSIQPSVKEEYNISDTLDEKAVIDNHENSDDDTLHEVKEAIVIEEVNLKSDEHGDIVLDDNTPSIRGKVSKMIRQLSSNTEHKQENKLILDDKVPKPKSVLSKIAMFEHPNVSSNVPKSLNKSSIKPVPRYTEEDFNKPYIVNGTRKTTNNTVMYEENNNLVHNVTTEEVDVSTLTIIDDIPKAEEITIEDPPSQHDVILKEDPIEINSNKIEETELEAVDSYRIEYAKPMNYIENVPLNNEPSANQIRILNNNEDVVNVNYNDDKTENSNKVLNESYSDIDIFKNTPKDNNQLSNRYFDKGTEKTDFKRSRSRSDDSSRAQRIKSVADLDLGDAVKGKVHNMIVRMNSVEMLNVEKKEVISAKERPRKKSVSEKIALFESKFSVAPVASVAHSSTSARTTKPQQHTPVAELRDEELQAKIKELKSAKLTYGPTEVNKTVVLANGVEMPALAIGTALLDPKLTVHIVSAAIDLGYRAIDTAYIYGNEKEVGEAIRNKIEDGTIRREDLFVISKLWSTFHRTELVASACRRSLDVLGLDYVDLFLIHNPMSFKEGPDPIPKIANVLQYSQYDYLDAWFGVEELVPMKLARSVGVSNFNSSQLQRLLDKAKVKPVVNQVECHPYLSQHKLDEFCSERHIKLSCFGVLGSGGTPMDLKGFNNPVLEDPLVQVMAAGLGITPAQLLIRYQLELGRAVVVKASSGSRLYENLQAMNCSLSEGELDALAALNRNRRTFTFKGMGDTHKNYPFKAQF
ncbi:unnamed protein product [Chilo suppressalis]|uniref:NADP-dependent oxidoreductase domain-containing protein n=1 Tax=Chilo suppressalis TaxID=168631 RepID=A0ABN8L9V4_CHISP|nr:unnamed protein product [Chilo suppressalis]